MQQNEYLATRLWAKTDPFHFLWQHLLDTAAVARALMPRFVPEGTLPLSPAWLCYLVALHDIGKADPFFQFKPRDLVAWETAGRPRFHEPFASRVDFPAWEAADLNINVDSDYTIGFRHEGRSADWLRDYHLAGTFGWGQSAIAVVESAIRGHHADFDAGIHDVSEDDPYVRSGERWRPIRDALATRVATVLGIPEDPMPAPQSFTESNASRVGLLLSGLIVLSDWIASNDQLFRYRTIAEETDPAAYFAAAQKLARDAVHALQFDSHRESIPSDIPRFTAVWTGDAYRNLRPTQQTLETAVLAGNVPPGLAIIEAPMGEGKTEAAIYLAEVWNRTTGRLGTYIALPTQATSNQMFGRYESFLNRTRPTVAPRLLHGMAWLREEIEGTGGDPESFGAEGDPESHRARTWFFENTKRGLLAAESVGTIDQALFAALNVRHGFLRLFGLSARTLIVDEAHAYDDFMTAILCRLLQWLHTLNVPTILLSATLSRVQKAKLLQAWNGSILPETDATHEAYPLIIVAPFGAAAKSAPITLPVSHGTRTSTVSLKRLTGFLQNAEKTAAFAADLIRDNGGCLCVLVNTVAQAQAVYATLAQRKTSGDLPEDCVLLAFHARFPARRRNAIEQQVTRLFGKTAAGDITNPDRPRCAILVATQVVEQSLDVDFDAMLSEIAPIDLLLQRSGRLHRHAGRYRPELLRDPVLYIIAPEPGEYSFGSSGKVYAPYVLLRTLAHLQTGTADTVVFHAPADFRPTIEAVYGETLPHGTDEPLALAIAEAKSNWLEKTQVKEDKATTHLIQQPREKSFAYAPLTAAVDEDSEGNGARSYLRAKTRDDDGEPTRSILCLTDAADYQAWGAASKKTGTEYPSRSILRHLFLCKATVPARWLTNVPETPDGTPPPRWLKGHTVLPLKKTADGLFRFEDADRTVRLWSEETSGLFKERNGDI